MYPPRNPFPTQATTIIEGSPAGESTQLTLTRPSFDRLSALVDRYLLAYDVAHDDDGVAIAVYGEHGSGKTHALAHAMQVLLKVDSETPVQVLYVRADSPDLLSFYRKLMSQVSLPKLRELCRLAREQYAREELAVARGLDPTALDVAVAEANAGDDWVERAFATADLQATAVLDRQIGDLAREGMRRKDFERAVPNLLNRDLDDIAYRWLTGEWLPDSDLRALGITENIDDALKIRTGIQALLILSRRAGQPIALLIDQTEALITSEDGSLHLDNVGALRAVLETVVGNSGLLLTAIRESTWNALPPDLRQRFGPSEIAMVRLGVREAAELIALYVAPWASDEQSTTYPFLPDGLRETLVASGGNIRRFIQLCCLMFAIAAPTQQVIGGALVRNVLSEEAEPVPTKDTLRGWLTDLLVAAHAPYEADFELDDAMADFAVKDAAGDGVRALIVVTEALVGEPELRVAQRTLDLMQRVQGHDRPAEVALVVGGYLSPEVASELTKVHRVLVVTGESGLDDLAALVADLSPPAPVGVVGRTTLSIDGEKVLAADALLREQLDQVLNTDAALRTRLDQTLAASTSLADYVERALAEDNSVLRRIDQVLTSLAAIEADRNQQQWILAERVEALGQTQGDRRQADDTAEAAHQWRTTEESLRDEILAVRNKRLREDLAELERLRARGVRRRLLTVLLEWLIPLATLITLGVWLLVTRPLHNTSLAWLPPLAIAPIILALTSLLSRLLSQQRREGDLRRRVTSLAELTRLARIYVQGEPHQQLRGPALLSSSNPQIVYAGAIQTEKLQLSALTRALARERSAIARRSLARKLAADHGIDGFEAVLDTIGTDSAASAAFDGLTIAYGRELPARKLGVTRSRKDSGMPGSAARSVPQSLPVKLSGAFTPELRVVAQVYGFAMFDIEANLLDDFIQSDIRRQHEYQHDIERKHERRRRDYVRKLRQSYDEGDEVLLLQTLPRFTERELRAAAATLSPFESGKAGAFDWLDKIADLEEIYLFFQKCLFYLGRGIPALPPNS